MRFALAELAPRPADLAANLRKVESVVRAVPAEVVVFPELFLSGYHVGDRLRSLALRAGDASTTVLGRLAHESGRTIVVGAPWAAEERPGEVENAAVVFDPDGAVQRASKRYLPTFGPFEEGLVFTPSARARAVEVRAAKVGIEVCYDVFFPEVSRELALDGARLLVNLSASPVTSRKLFEKLLPARAAENGLPLLYVNRVGVEDGLVFAGGSGAWDARGEPSVAASAPVPGLGEGERVLTAEVDLAEAERWRPFRPVLRDVAARPPTGPSIAG